VGDRFVIRRPSPPETLGGGEIADASSERVRRRADALASLERRATPSGRSRLLAVLDVPRDVAEAAARSGLALAEAESAAAELQSGGQAVKLADALLAQDAFASLATRVERALAAAHRRAPLRLGMPREELRSTLGLPPRRFAALVELLARQGRLSERGSALALPDHIPSLTPVQEAAWNRARESLARDPLLPPSPASLRTEHGIDAEVVAALAERGDLVRIGTEAVFLPDAVERFAKVVVDELAARRTITVSRARDLTGSSRKHVLPLLQLLDDQGITRRTGDDRVLVISPEQAATRIATLTRRKEVAR
jgi:selenocysteine-specific elongation factor